ncbi:MAG: LytTR family transcriptional regulator [Bacteroidales bacterium]|nr:LytTR family transcriptional regulator [Bacteroidales bacterium]
MEKTDNTNGTLVLKTRKGLFRIDADDILYIECEDYFCTLFMADGQRYDCTRKLSFFEERLQGSHFMLISRSLLVNMAQIASLHHVKDKKWTAVLRSANGSTMELEIAYRRCSQVKAEYAAFTHDKGAFT